MKKIRINELARELEVKAHEILDLLPELGVTEKKTHSSSIDEDVAIKLRRRYGFDADGNSETHNGGYRAVAELEPDTKAEQEPPAESPVVPAVKPEPPQSPASKRPPRTPRRFVRRSPANRSSRRSARCRGPRVRARPPLRPRRRCPRLPRPRRQWPTVRRRPPG
jgi:translation initiation factor IF-2